MIEGGTSRTVSLDTLVTVQGPLTVSVRASTGRVSAVALNRRSLDFAPTGADWQVSAVPPAHSVVIPGIPEGSGTRTLLVANPGTNRAQVSVSVLGAAGGFAPAGAETVEVPPESTAEVSVAQGLAGAAAGIQLTSDQPITGSVISEAIGKDALPDIAIQSASAPIVRTGVVPLVYLDKTDAQLVLSNGGDGDVPLTFEVYGYDGVKIHDDDVLLVPHATATRRLTMGEAAYLVVSAPAGATVMVASPSWPTPVASPGWPPSRSPRPTSPVGLTPGDLRPLGRPLTPTFRARGAHTIAGRGRRVRFAPAGHTRSRVTRAMGAFRAAGP